MVATMGSNTYFFGTGECNNICEKDWVNMYLNNYTLWKIEFLQFIQEMDSILKNIPTRT